MPAFAKKQDKQDKKQAWSGNELYEGSALAELGREGYNPLYQLDWEAPSPRTQEDAEGRGEPFQGLFDERGLSSRRELEQGGGTARLWHQAYRRLLGAVDGYHGKARSLGDVSQKPIVRASQGKGLETELYKVREATAAYNERHDGEDGARQERVRKVSVEVEGERRHVEAVVSEGAYDQKDNRRPWTEALALRRSGYAPTPQNRVQGHDDSSLKGEMKPLGKGGVNEVFQGMYDGEKQARVWKEEKHGEQVPVEGDRGLRIPENDRHYAARNVAASRLNDLFGLDVIPKTDFAVHDGRLGTVMEKVQGAQHAYGHEHRRLEGADEVNAKDLMDWQAIHAREAKDPDRSEKDRAQSADWARSEQEDIKRKGYEQKKDGIHGDVQCSNGIDYDSAVVKKGLSTLQLLDALCAAGDRHAGNYMFETDRHGQVSGVKGIDNDFGFARGDKAGDPDRLVGYMGGHNLGVPEQVDRKVAKAFLGKTEADVRNCLAGLLPQEEIDATAERFRAIQVRLRDKLAKDELVRDWDSADMKGDGKKPSYWSRDKKALEAMPRSQEAQRREADRVRIIDLP